MKFIALSNFKNGKDDQGNGVQVKAGQSVEMSEAQAKPFLKAGLISSHEDVLAQKKENLQLKIDALDNEKELLQYEISQLGKQPKAVVAEGEEAPAPKKKRVRSKKAE